MHIVNRIDARPIPSDDHVVCASSTPSSRDGVRCRPPTTPDVLVARPKLVARVRDAAAKKLVVVAAPPGYGKSVLLADWARTEQQRAVTWYTVASSDDASDVARHLCAALTQVDGRPRDHLADQVGARALGDDFTAALLASTETLPPTTLVLDDFHELASTTVAAELASIFEKAPPLLHFIVAARVDPPLSLHRFRFIDEFAEFRADDLRLSASASIDLVRELTGHDLTETQVAVLMDRTEGWVTGMQLASLSLRAVDDIDGFIAAFAGDDRHVSEYLTEHVLQGLEPEIRDFLLQTSVLDVLTGSLCDAVTGRDDGDAMLERVTRGSLFVAAVDRRRERFRCHRLFRDLLRSHLDASDPTLEHELLHRAAAWHLERDDIETAGGYILATGDDAQILEAVHSHGRSVYRTGHTSTVVRWLHALSPETRQRKDVALLEAGCQMLSGSTAVARSILDHLRSSGEVDDRDLLLIDFVTTWSVFDEPATERVVSASDRSIDRLDRLSERELPALAWLVSPAIIRKGCLVNRATAAFFAGAARPAQDDLQAAARLPHASTLLEIDEASLSALTEAWTGSLRMAEQHARHATRVADDAGVRSYPGTAVALLASAHVMRLRGLMEPGRATLEAANTALQQTRPSLLLAVLAAESALVDLAEDHIEAGLATIAAHRSRDLAVHPAWVAEQVDVAEVRLLVASGELERAQQLVDRLVLTSSETTDVKVLLAVERGDRVLARVLLAGWPESESTRSHLQRNLWRCILNEDDGTGQPGDLRLARLLEEANDDGHVQLLLEAGREGRRLLRAHSNVAPTSFLRRLIDVPAPQARGSVAKLPQLVEQLTDRELMVLRYLPTGLDNTEIADVLGISVNTLKTHLKHVFRKFDVGTRRSAVDVAEQLMLL